MIMNLYETIKKRRGVMTFDGSPVNYSVIESPSM